MRISTRKKKNQRSQFFEFVRNHKTDIYGGSQNSNPLCSVQFNSICAIIAHFQFGLCCFNFFQFLQIAHLNLNKYLWMENWAVYFGYIFSLVAWFVHAIAMWQKSLAISSSCDSTKVTENNKARSAKSRQRSLCNLGIELLNT